MLYSLKFLFTSRLTNDDDDDDAHYYFYFLFEGGRCEYNIWICEGGGKVGGVEALPTKKCISLLLVCFLFSW